MRAAVFDASFDLRLKDIPRVLPADGEVEVRVIAAGLCAGDLYIYLGKNPYVTFRVSAAMRSRARSAPSVLG
jgi:L-gulonate 5-dehydrogenase